MARYTGPRSKISRRFGIPIFDDEKVLEKRPTPPGVHGAKRQKKKSDYGIALGEKQKLKFMYGVMEKQFRRYFDIAQRKRGVTGETLLQLLETRLDNVVYRLGFADSRAQARQLVRHGHIDVNGRKTDIPSFIVSAGDVISVRQGSSNNTYFKERAQIVQSGYSTPDWLTLNPNAMTGTVVTEPSREDIEIPLNEQLIVEYYSR